MYRQPNGRFVWCGPLYAMSPAGRDDDKITRLHREKFGVVFEPQLRFSLQQQHPFVLMLIVPEVVGRGVSMRNDPLDPQRLILEESLDNFVGQVGWDVGEDVVHAGRFAVVQPSSRICEAETLVPGPS